MRPHFVLSPFFLIIIETFVDVNLIAFNTSTMELIPIIVSLLRNKSQGLDISQDEERLRPAVKAFHTDLQSANPYLSHLLPESF